MKYLIIISALLFSSTGYSQLSDKDIHNLKTRRYIDDTSYVYSLPYESGKRYLFVQGANSKFSHKNDLAYDFKMATGTKVCAARNGKVIAVRSDSKQGGMKPGNLADANYIVIQHEDSSKANYWHLDFDGPLVRVGDTVKQGQVIGLSGNTGYSAFPHLHFKVYDKNGKEILVRFKTMKGIIYLRPGRWYKSLW